MILNDMVCVIPAIKKNAVIPDQLVKKLVDVTLIQWTIDLALKIFPKNLILIVTDSQEITLISERNEIDFYYDRKLKLDSEKIELQLVKLLKKKLSNKPDIFLLRGNTPLLNKNTLKEAIDKFKSEKNKILVSAITNDKSIFLDSNSKKIFLDGTYSLVKAFSIFPFFDSLPRFLIHVIPKNEAIEINSYQNWWVCEKLLKRKKIIFNVIGGTDIGMGHIYRSLSVAHEITDHNIVFVSDKNNQLAISNIAATDYKVIEINNPNDIINLNPDLVINDRLDTDSEYMSLLKENEIKSLNFEDLGKGAPFADVVINEIYEEPLNDHSNVMWGSKYFFLRDEFIDSTPNKFSSKIKSVLILFGGTDQNNMTCKVLNRIIENCISNKILIKIVCGKGYLFINELNQIISKLNYNKIQFFHSTKKMSMIMEDTSIAISSNGRTIFELAQMNIPSIVVSSNKRELKHDFSNTENGFINLGLFNDEVFNKINLAFNELINNEKLRRSMHEKLMRFNFLKNKKKLFKIINNLIEN